MNNRTRVRFVLVFALFVHIAVAMKKNVPTPMTRKTTTPDTLQKTNPRPSRLRKKFDYTFCLQLTKNHLYFPALKNI